ncbi:hypothetical protein [Vibrio mangrovi]|uniref:Uncharacterized protein n=1 Tax=Vibrio mangrovi TaxID=474394 RepID=A0A1Y6ITP2_9VIBR|nr:hypothetical protein [Vibrio mangrovi]MDW6004734.1 hypothetical protein [Vibrio mangrovi]SMS01025.1 hypothetical protein VIM7927_02302 [Vibrio mangrovi]
MKVNTAYQYSEQDASQTVSEVMCLCGHRICDREGVIRSRCVKIVEGMALCRCKRWVRVPISNQSIKAGQ